MSVDIERVRRRRRSRGEWQRVIAAQAESGVSQEAYCTRHRIGYSSFCRWKRELGDLKPLAKVPLHGAFVELTAAPVAARWEVEVELGEGVYLRVRRS